jgi:hypothetical protein
MKKILILFLILINGCSSYVPIETNENSFVQKEILEGRMGRPIIVEDIKYALSKIESYKEIGSGSVSQGTDGLFYVVYLSVENLKDTTHLFSPRINMLDDSENQKYDPELNSVFYLNNFLEWEKNLGAHQRFDKIIVFEMPENSKRLKLEIKDDWEKVSKIQFGIQSANVNFLNVSQAVRDAKESELLKAKIN